MKVAKDFDKFNKTKFHTRMIRLSAAGMRDEALQLTSSKIDELSNRSTISKKTRNKVNKLRRLKELLVKIGNSELRGNYIPIYSSTSYLPSVDNANPGNFYSRYNSSNDVILVENNLNADKRKPLSNFLTCLKESIQHVESEGKETAIRQLNERIEILRKDKSPHLGQDLRCYRKILNIIKKEQFEGKNNRKHKRNHSRPRHNNKYFNRNNRELTGNTSAYNTSKEVGAQLMKIKTEVSTERKSETVSKIERNEGSFNIMNIKQEPKFFNEV